MNTTFDLLLKPLAKLAIARGLRFSDVSDRLRRAFLNEATLSSGPDAPISRLSVMTGLQRRDISRLFAESEAPAKVRPDIMSRLVAQWLTQFDGEPLPHHGTAGSFDTLAKAVHQDIHPRSVLDTLIAAGTVDLQGGTVSLLKHAYVPLEGSEAQMLYLGQNVGDHLSVAVNNVLGEETSFDQAVHYNHLSKEAVQTLENLWRERMKTVLIDVNKAAAELQNLESGAERFRAGGYFYKETEK